MSENNDVGFDAMEEVSIIIMSILVILSALVYMISKFCSCYYVYKKRDNKINKALAIGLQANPKDVILNIPSPQSTESNSSKEDDLEKEALVNKNDN